MIDRTTKLRWRRRFRARRRRVEDLGVQAEEQLEQHFFKRLSRLATIRRFVFSWILLFVLLIGGVLYQTSALSGYYESARPVPGGIYTEGMIGTYTDANPLYASSAVDSAVSKLIFSSLFKYDQNGKLIGDLATSWTVDDKGTTYTVTLRKDLQWQDGTPLTAKDVVFTYDTIQNPDAKSPLMTSWQGIKVTAVGDRVVTFMLPNVLASFPYSLINGIVPEHLLASTPVTQLRALPFNTLKPIGAGPFKMEEIEITGDKPENREGKIALVPNQYYYAGAPKLQRFVIHSFLDQDRMIESFKQKELTAISGLDSVPEALANDLSVEEYNIPLSGEVMVFFKTSQPVLSDYKVRQALVQAVNEPSIVKHLGFPVLPAKGPLLNIHLGYDPALTQLPYDPTQANKLLDDDGWVKGSDGMRSKAGKPLTFSLYSQNKPEYANVTQQLQLAWAKIGVKVDVQLQSPEDLQGTVSGHDYDALLYGISLGPDPDVFAYWHSTQADPRAANRVNFSEYKSSAADKALEGGRTRTDPTLRAIKYKPFLTAWRNDAPALALYQPRYLYITRDKVANFNPKYLNATVDRYSNVDQWMIRQVRMPN